MKLKEKKKAPIRRRKPHLKKDKPTISAKSTRTKRHRASAAALEYAGSEDENLEDGEIATAVNNLHNVLEYTKLPLDDDISFNIFDSLA